MMNYFFLKLRRLKVVNVMFIKFLLYIDVFEIDYIV